MEWVKVLELVPTFVLAFFRLGALVLSAPLFGSTRIPKRVKVMFSLALACALTPNIRQTVVLPESMWSLAVGIGGEIIFGYAMGAALSFTFVAVHWAGEIIGQQMGFNLGEVFDPSMGQGGSVIGDLYFMLTLAIFLIAGGHHALLRGVVGSFDSLPLMSAGAGRGIIELMTGLLTSAMQLALQLAAPVLVTVMVVDLSLGFMGKTLPQLNIMAAGLSIRAGVGILVLVIGAYLTSDVIRDHLTETVNNVAGIWANPSPHMFELH